MHLMDGLAPWQRFNNPGESLNHLWPNCLLDVVYFNQLSGAAHTQKLAELLFSAILNLFCYFKTFFSDFTAEINKKHPKKKLYLSNNS